MVLVKAPYLRLSLGYSTQPRVRFRSLAMIPEDTFALRTYPNGIRWTGNFQ